jgi:hypothetical protein
MGPEELDYVMETIEEVLDRYTMPREVVTEILVEVFNELIKTIPEATTPGSVWRPLDLTAEGSTEDNPVDLTKSETLEDLHSLLDNVITETTLTFMDI